MQSQLLYNKWFGKAVGAAGACIWGPADAIGFSAAIIVGIALGHLYDWWAWRRYVDDCKGFAAVPENVKGARAGGTPNLEYLFAAMGSLAKSSGTVRLAHIEATERLIRRFQFTAADRRRAIGWFNEGKDNEGKAANQAAVHNAALEALARECLGADPRAVSLRQLTLESLCEIAAITPTPPVIARLKQLGQSIGFSNGRIGEVFGEAHVRIPRIDPGPYRAPAPGTHAADPEQLARAAYVLQVAQDTPLVGAKRAYRRLVSRYHPDKLGNNPSRKALDYAQARMIELREALEVFEALDKR